MRELRLFLTLAEELHFGRTAERLRVTPTRVSQSLRTLEGKLGAQLLHRTSRRVELTAFGTAFLRDVAPAVERLDGVLEQTHDAALTVEGTLRLGLLSGPAAGPRLVELIRAFESAYAGCTVEVVQLSWDDPIAPLRAGDVDAIATWIPLEDPDLVVGPILSTEPRVLAVARSHALAARESIDVEELAEHPSARFDSWPREMHEAVIPSRTPRGRPIPASRLPAGERAVLDIAVRVARGELVHPTVATAAPYMGSLDLRFVPITGMPPLSSALVWRKPARDPRLRAFLGIADDVLGG